MYFMLTGGRVFMLRRWDARWRPGMWGKEGATPLVVSLSVVEND